MRGRVRTCRMLSQVFSAAPSTSQGHSALHTFRICPPPNASLVRRVASSVGQLPYLPLDVRRFHYRSAHKKCLSTCGFESSNVLRRFYPTLRNDWPIHVDVL